MKCVRACARVELYIYVYVSCSVLPERKSEHNYRIAGHFREAHFSRAEQRDLLRTGDLERERDLLRGGSRTCS